MVFEVKLDRIKRGREGVMHREQGRCSIALSLTEDRINFKKEPS